MYTFIRVNIFQTYSFYLNFFIRKREKEKFYPTFIDTHKHKLTIFNIN